MIIFLEKVRTNTSFSIVNPIVTEPIELLYIRAVLDQEGIESYLIDTLFEIIPPEKVIPDLVILTGYNVAENNMIKRAREYKSRYKNVKTMVSGVHAQINRDVFRVEFIDFVYFSQSLETFRKYLKGESINGIDYYDNNMNEWILGKEDTLLEKEEIIPNRKIFDRFADKTKYLDKKNVRLIKGSHGCPYKCSFCYCRLLNTNFYIKADYDKMFNEIKSVEADHYWIVDDSLFISRDDAKEFIKQSKNHEFNKKILGYLRADFVIENKDLLKQLKESGIDEIIIGFESANNNTLKEYGKSLNSNSYKEVVRLLKEVGIHLTALFIVDPNYGFKDFSLLNRFIKESKIEVFTLSIMTPIKGTKDYEEKKEMLTTHDPKNFDFLHLVVPSKLPKGLFYFLFYWTHIRLLKSKRIRKMLRGSI